MQYLSIVHMLQCKADLGKPIKHVVFTPVLQLSTTFISDLVFLLNPSLQVTTISEVHNDAELSLFGLVHLAEAHNVGVVQHLQDLCFSESLFTLILRHCLDIDLLDNG